MKRKEAYQLVVNGVKYYFAFSYGGWMTASKFVFETLGLKGNYPLKRVLVSSDRYLPGE